MKQDVVMHKNSPSLHLFSGFIAFTIYVIMLVLIVGGFKLYKEQVRYGELDSNLSEIIVNESIELSEVIDKNEEQNTQLEQITEEIKEPVEEVAQPLESIVITQEKQQIQQKKEVDKKTQESKQVDIKPKKEVNLVDVFSNVSSETLKDRKAKEDEKRKQELETQKRMLEEAQKARADQLAQNAAAIKQGTQALQQATKNLQDNVKKALTTRISLEKPKFVGNSDDKAKYDKWYAQIEQILMSEWKKSSNFYQASTSAKVKINIDSGGKLTYLFMVIQSPYVEYNNSVVVFMKKMETRLFPAPPGDGVELAVSLENTLKHK